jgi:hypothetical protein
MSLRDRLRRTKTPATPLATAIPAKAATDTGETVATIATLAVATAPADFPALVESGVCPDCGGGYAYQQHPGDGWRCVWCNPPTVALGDLYLTRTDPAGRLPELPHQDTNSVLVRAADAAGVSAAALRASLGEDDLQHIAAGRHTADYLAGYAWTLIQTGELRPLAAGDVRCGECRHFQRREHPNLGDCGAGERPPGAAGFWDTDKRGCDRWRPMG